MYKYTIKISIFTGPGKRFVIREYLKSYTTKLSLTIKNVRDTDFGTYRCLAKNSLGDSDGSIKLSGTATIQNKTSLIIILLGDFNKRGFNACFLIQYTYHSPSEIISFVLLIIGARTIFLAIVFPMSYSSLNLSLPMHRTRCTSCKIH